MQYLVSQCVLEMDLQYGTVTWHCIREFTNALGCSPCARGQPDSTKKHAWHMLDLLRILRSSSTRLITSGCRIFLYWFSGICISRQHDLYHHVNPAIGKVSFMRSVNSEIKFNLVHNGIFTVIRAWFMNLSRNTEIFFVNHYARLYLEYLTRKFALLVIATTPWNDIFWLI